MAHPFAWVWRRVGRSVRWFLELYIFQFGNYSHSFPLPCKPVRLNLDHSLGSCLIVPVAAPLPVFGTLHQSTLHRLPPQQTKKPARRGPDCDACNAASRSACVLIYRLNRQPKLRSGSMGRKGAETVMGLADLRWQRKCFFELSSACFLFIFV